VSIYIRETALAGTNGRASLPRATLRGTLSTELPAAHLGALLSPLTPWRSHASQDTYYIRWAPVCRRRAPPQPICESSQAHGAVRLQLDWSPVEPKVQHDRTRQPSPEPARYATAPLHHKMPREARRPDERARRTHECEEYQAARGGRLRRRRARARATRCGGRSRAHPSPALRAPGRCRTRQGRHGT